MAENRQETNNHQNTDTEILLMFAWNTVFSKYSIKSIILIINLALMKNEMLLNEVTLQKSKNI